MEEHVLVSSGMDGFIRIWDCTDQSAVSDVMALESRDGITALEVAPAIGERAVLVTGTVAGTIQIRDLRSKRGEGDKSVTSHKGSVTCIAFDSGYSVVTGDAKGAIEVRDLRSLRHMPVITLNGSWSEFESRVIHAVRKFPTVTGKTARVDITEDMWAAAIGKKRKANQTPDVIVESATKPTQQEPAHSSKVISIGYRGPHRYTSVGQDKTIKSFCAVSGQLLRVDNTREKPLASCFSNDLLVLTARNGLTFFKDSASRLTSLSEGINTHVGSVTAVCPTGSWGICSGGTDKHIFINSFSSS